MKLAGQPATEAKHMNNWLNKLERKYGRYGIPNLTNILAVSYTHLDVYKRQGLRYQSAREGP